MTGAPERMEAGGLRRGVENDWVSISVPARHLEHPSTGFSTRWSSMTWSRCARTSERWPTRVTERRRSTLRAPRLGAPARARFSSSFNALAARSGEIAVPLLARFTAGSEELIHDPALPILVHWWLGSIPRNNSTPSSRRRLAAERLFEGCPLRLRLRAEPARLASRLHD